MKKCRICRKEKPNDLDHFAPIKHKYRDKHGVKQERNYLNTACRPCTNVISKKNKAKKKANNDLSFSTPKVSFLKLVFFKSEKDTQKVFKIKQAINEIKCLRCKYTLIA